MQAGHHGGNEGCQQRTRPEKIVLKMDSSALFGPMSERLPPAFPGFRGIFQQ